MSYTIAVAGKGGTGKTTLAALLIDEMIHRGKKPVLAVDADANANLNEHLGISAGKSVGGIREDMQGSINKVPVGMSKMDYVEMNIQESLVESKDFDLLSMGRPEGAGCYCYANNLIRKYVDILSKNYPVVLIDNEAGMEHLSRRTTRHIDFLILMTDPSLRGLRTLGRIKELIAELNLDVRKVGVVVSRTQNGLSKEFHREVEKMGLNLTGMIPDDSSIYEHDSRGIPLTELPDNTPAKSAVREICSHLEF
jgi:CO dehydrogenase maturation factor